jgi:hypothetical protein
MKFSEFESFRFFINLNYDVTLSTLNKDFGFLFKILRKLTSNQQQEALNHKYHFQHLTVIVPFPLSGDSPEVHALPSTSVIENKPADLGQNYEEVEQEDFARLKNWIGKNGGYVSNKITLCGNSNYRGIFCTEEVKKNEAILSIPQKLHIRKCNHHYISIGNVIKQLPDIFFQTLCLMHERNNKESHWAPYLQMLPKDDNNIQFYKSKNSILNEYANINLPYKKEVLALWNALEKDYELIINFLKKNIKNFDHELFSWENFVYNFKLVESRTFGNTLLPGIDFINCHYIINNINHTEYYKNFIKIDNSLKRFIPGAKPSAIMAADGDYKPKEELFWMYGRRSRNTNFLNMMIFGYTPKENPYDFMLLGLKLSPEVNFYQEKFKFFKENNLFNFRDEYMCSIGHNSESISSILAFLRASLAEKEEDIKKLLLDEDYDHGIRNISYKQLINICYTLYINNVKPELLNLEQLSLENGLNDIEQYFLNNEKLLINTIKYAQDKIKSFG